MGEEGEGGWEVSYQEEDSLDSATKLSPGLGFLGVHEQVGWDTLDGHTLVPGQHPDDHVWNTVLGLECERDGTQFWGWNVKGMEHSFGAGM